MTILLDDDLEARINSHVMVTSKEDLYLVRLRDHFAGQALAGLMAKAHSGPKDFAWIAYQIADAMLEARKK